MAAKLTAYYGGSGMWDVRSADSKRIYNVRTSGRGKVIITNRRGDVLNPNGPTAAEVLRAMNAARKLTEHQSSAHRRGDVLNPNGPTAAEVLRAMNAARKLTEHQSSAHRRGDVLNPNGPTAAEVLRAMNAARKLTEHQSSAHRR